MDMMKSHQHSNIVGDDELIRHLRGVLSTKIHDAVDGLGRPVGT